MIKDEAEIEEFYKNDKKMAEEKIKLFHFSEWFGIYHLIYSHWLKDLIPETLTKEDMLYKIHEVLDYTQAKLKEIEDPQSAEKK